MRPGFLAALIVAVMAAVAFSGCGSLEEAACAQGKRLIRDGGVWSCATFYGTPTPGDHVPFRRG